MTYYSPEFSLNFSIFVSRAQETADKPQEPKKADSGSGSGSGITAATISTSNKSAAIGTAAQGGGNAASTSSNADAKDSKCGADFVALEAVEPATAGIITLFLFLTGKLFLWIGVTTSVCTYSQRGVTCALRAILMAHCASKAAATGRNILSACVTFAFIE